MNNLEQHEPTAEQREGARAVATMYVGLIQEGFSPSQALYLVGQYLRGAISAGGDTPSDG